jgi:peptidoglycan/xylan/chitin deacetylase (PgdA/CDA1 family)
MFYFAKTPWWLKKLYGRCIWGFSPIKKTIYLTFDDGPNYKATPFVLAELKKYNAKATFFCIGKNVVENNDIYQRVINEGHGIGNHTYNHLNGWETPNNVYIDNIDKANILINSDLFRPPYGKMKQSQIKLLSKLHPSLKIIMWSVLSGDFDMTISPEKCLKNVVHNAQSGAIVVFHDSEKAFNNLVYTLPLVLKYFSGKGFTFEKIA